jgi:hypothetical protein
MPPVHLPPRARLIGYFAKPTMKRPDWLKAGSVLEICSASQCLSGGDWDWINEWLHNDMWVLDTPELAWKVVPESEHGRCDLYAYKVFPVRYVEGRRESFALPGCRAQPLDESFVPLGFDLVSRSCDNAFECSPLSCNGLAGEVPVNRHCLLDTVAEAFALASTLDAPGQPLRGEPGPYYIVEIWRQRGVVPAGAGQSQPKQHEQ